MNTSRRSILQAAAILPAAAAIPAVAAPKPQPDTRDRIMYICTNCADNYPEGCGHFGTDDLRVTPNGDWICDSCFADAFDGDFGLAKNEDGEWLKDWHDLPKPPTYGPIG